VDPAPRDSSRLNRVLCGTIARVSSTWPPAGPQKREPLLDHVRDVWTLRYFETNCTAAIWRNDFGLELRVEHGGELMEIAPVTLRHRAAIADRRSDQSESDRARMVRSRERDTLMYRVVPRWLVGRRIPRNHRGRTSITYCAFAGTIRGSTTNRFGSRGSIRTLTQWVLRAPKVSMRVKLPNTPPPVV